MKKCCTKFLKSVGILAAVGAVVGLVKKEKSAKKKKITQPQS